jgi:hypothetical protein
MLGQQTVYLEQQIAAALTKKNAYAGKVSSDELGSILTKVLETVVTEQKFAGLDVPVKHTVTAMDVAIERGKAYVACVMQIHAPINATLMFDYALENDPKRPTRRLRLHNNHVEIQEMTGTFDFAAKMALRMMNVKQIVMQQLSNPNKLIRRVLPVHLVRQGFQGRICDVGLQILPDDTIAISITGDRGMVH